MISLTLNLSKSEEEKAAEIHEKAFIFDALIPALDDILLRRNKGERKVLENTYLPKMRLGGLDGGNLNIANPSIRGFKHVLDNLVSVYAELEESGDKFSVVTTTEELIKRKEEGKQAFFLQLQNAQPISEDISLLTILKKLGISAMQLCYSERTEFADGYSERGSAGLSYKGVKLIEGLNKSHIVIDLSHAGRKAFMDALETSKDPVIVSHANTRSICNNIRNLDDEQIKALAEKNGVMGVMAGHASFVIPHQKPSIVHILDHVDKIVEIAGINHVGIGLDLEDYIHELFRPIAERLVKEKPEIFGTILAPVEGLEDVTKLINFTRGLVSRGYSEQEIEKILGLNFLRVYRRILH